MNCGWMERVALAMDGEWTPELDRHVAGCAECRELLADRELLRAAPEIAPEAYSVVRERVRAAVRPSYAMWWRAAAAVLVAALGLTWWLTRMPGAERLEIAVSAPGVAAPLTIGSGAAEAARGLKPTPPSGSLNLVTGLGQATLKPTPRVERTNVVGLAMRLREELEAQPPRMEGEVAVAMQTEDPEVFILLVGGEDDE
jgi:hypothetical protein